MITNVLPPFYGSQCIVLHCSWVWETCPRFFYTAAPWPGIEARICDTLIRRSTSKPPRIFEDKDFPRGQQHWYVGLTIFLFLVYSLCLLKVKNATGEVLTTRRYTNLRLPLPLSLPLPLPLTLEENFTRPKALIAIPIASIYYWSSRPIL